MRAVRLRVGYKKAFKHFDLMEDYKFIKDEKTKKKLIGRYRKTRVPCSCYMCGNPRRKFGNGKEATTLQEKKQKISVIEETNEIFEKGGC